MPSTIVVNPDDSVTITLPQITFDGSYDLLGTCTATMTITPEGGASTLAALLDGPPGLPATFRNVTVTPIPAGETGYAEPALVNPGGAGQSSVYDLNVWWPLPEPGDMGPAGTIMNAADLNNSPTAGYVLSTDGTKGTWVPFAPVRPFYTVTSSSFNIITGTIGTSTGVLTTLNIPAQPFRYRPKVSGMVPITSAADTWIDVQAMMGPTTSTPATIAATGTQIGYGVGAASASAFAVRFQEAFGAAMTPSDTSPAAVVPAGTQQTIVVSALRQYGASAWSTAQSLNTNARAELHVELMPV